MEHGGQHWNTVHNNECIRQAQRTVDICNHGAEKQDCRADGGQAGGSHHTQTGDAGRSGLDAQAEHTGRKQRGGVDARGRAAPAQFKAGARAATL